MADDHDDLRNDDLHDDELSRALAVDPLDELTRRRLVAGALSVASDASVASRPGRGRLAAVAAAAALVVLGIAALALPGGDPAEVAGRREQQQSLADRSAQEKAAPGAPDAASAAAADSAHAPQTETPAAGRAAGDVVHLGDLGDLSAPGARQRVLATATPRVAGIEPAGAIAITVGTTCETRSDADVVATGTGTLDGRAALVTVSRRDDGSLRVRAVDADDCELRPLP